MDRWKARGLGSIALSAGCVIYIMKDAWMALLIGVISAALIFILGE